MRPLSIQLISPYRGRATTNKLVCISSRSFLGLLNKIDSIFLSLFGFSPRCSACSSAPCLLHSHLQGASAMPSTAPQGQHPALGWVAEPQWGDLQHRVQSVLQHSGYWFLALSQGGPNPPSIFLVPHLQGTLLMPHAPPNRRNGTVLPFGFFF